MMRIVALVPGGICEQILFFPSLNDLKKAFPATEIDVVVEPKARGAYRVCQAVRDTIPFNFADRNSLADWSNLLGVLRDREYEAAISLDSDLGTNLVLWLTGIPTRIGYSTSSGSFLLTSTIPFKSQQMVAHRYHDLLRGLGLATPCSELSINVPRTDIDWSESEQKSLSIQDSGYVLVHPGSGQPNSDSFYATDNWQVIVKDFQNRQPKLPIVLVRTPTNDAQVQTIAEACPGSKTTVGSDIGKLAATIAGANLLISPDTSAIALAAALQVPTVGLFGSTDAQKLFPSSHKLTVVQSPSGQLSDIYPQMLLEQVWKG